jgi:hypothetical protein
MKAVIELERQGYQISLQGERLAIKKLAGAAPDAEKVNGLLQQVREGKAEAIEYLRSFEREIDLVVGELNKAWSASGCEMEDIPQERRDRALELEEDMTQAANAGDYQKARDALEQWRVCWMPPQGKWPTA